MQHINGRRSFCALIYSEYRIYIMNSYASAGYLPNKMLAAIYDICALKSQKQFADLMNAHKERVL